MSIRSSRWAARSNSSGASAAPAGGGREPGPHQLQARLLQVAERPGLRYGQQVLRGAGRPGLDLGLGRGQRPSGPPRRVAGQQRRALQERGRRGYPAARLRPARRPFELGGNVLVLIGRGLRQMPGPPVRIKLRVGHLGQRRVQLLPLGP